MYLLLRNVKIKTNFNLFNIVNVFCLIKVSFHVFNKHIKTETGSVLLIEFNQDKKAQQVESQT